MEHNWSRVASRRDSLSINWALLNAFQPHSIISVPGHHDSDWMASSGTYLRAGYQLSGGGGGGDEEGPGNDDERQQKPANDQPHIDN